MAQSLFEELSALPDVAEEPTSLLDELSSLPDIAAPVEQPPEQTQEELVAGTNVEGLADAPELGPALSPEQEAEARRASEEARPPLFQDIETIIVKEVPANVKRSIGGSVKFLGELSQKVETDITGIDSPLKHVILSEENRKATIELGDTLAREGAKEIAAAGRKARTDATEQFVVDVASATANMAPAILTGLVTGPAGGMTVIANQVFGDKFVSDREAGRSFKDSSQAALFHSAAEAIPEALPLNAILKPGATAVRRMLTATYGEAIQEGLTTILQDTFDETDLNKLSLKEAIQMLDWKHVGYNSLVGAFTGTTIAAGTHPFVSDPAQLQQLQDESLQESNVEPTLQDVQRGLQIEKGLQEAPPAIEIGETLPEEITPETLAEEQIPEVAELPTAEQIVSGQPLPVQPSISEELDALDVAPVTPIEEVVAEPVEQDRVSQLEAEVSRLVEAQETKAAEVEAAAVTPVEAARTVEAQKLVEQRVAEQEKLAAEVEQAGAVAPVVEPVVPEQTDIEKETAALFAEVEQAPVVEARPEVVAEIEQGNFPDQLNVAEVVEHINQRGRQDLDAGTVQEALGGATELELVDVPIGDVVTDVAPAEAALDESAEAFAEQPAETAPPVVLGQGNNIVDGRHRVEAAVLRGDTTIKAYRPVQEGTALEREVEAATTPESTDRRQEAAETSSLPESVSVGPTTVITKAITEPGGKVFRETSPQNLQDVLLSNRDGGVDTGFVADDPILALGQGQNKGIFIEFDGLNVSGEQHKKPGSVLVDVKEFRTNFIGKNAITKITVRPNIKIKKLDKQLIKQKFDVETLDDGSQVFTPKERRGEDRRTETDLRQTVDQLSERGFTDEQVESFTRMLRRSSDAAAAINTARAQAALVEVESEAKVEEGVKKLEEVSKESRDLADELNDVRAQLAEAEIQQDVPKTTTTTDDIQLTAEVQGKVPPAKPPKGPENVYPNDVPPGQPPANMEIDSAPVEMSLWDRFVKRAQDRMLPLKRAQQRAQKHGAKISEESDAYMTEELMQSRTQTALRSFWNESVEPILKELGKAKISREEFNSYLYAKHAPTRNEIIDERNPEDKGFGSGMTDAQATGILESLEVEGKTEVLESAAQKVYKILDQQRDTLVKSGLESAKTIKQWRETFGETYVPLKTTSENGSLQGIGRGVDTRGKNSQTAMGRASEAQDIFAHAVVQAQQTLIKSEKNAVGNAFLKFVQENPAPGLWEVNEVRVKRTLNSQTGEVELGIDRSVKYDPNVFVTKKDGKEFRITIKDVHLARAMKNMGVDKVGTATKVFAGLNRYLSAINTSFNPEFGPTNLARDIQTAVANIISEQELSDNPELKNAKFIAAKMVKDVPSAIRGAFIGLMNPESRLAQKLGANKDAAQWTKWFNEFSEEGGKIEFFGFKTIEDVNHELLARLNSKEETAVGKIVDAAHAIKRSADIINGAMENASRLAVYKNLREAGVSKKKAANVALNLTVNFYKKGEMGSSIGAFYLFYNASAQGAARMTHALKSKKLQGLMGAITVGAATLAEMNRYVGGDDEETGTNFYDTIPEHVKRRNLIIMTGEVNEDGEPVYLKFPLPYGYNIPHVIGTQANAMYHGKDKMEAGGAMMSAIMESFNPVGGDDSFAKQLAPTVSDPFIEIALNQDFASRKIAPEKSPFDRVDTPNSQLYWQNVNPTAKIFAQELNRLTGGNEFRPGLVDISPEALEHLGSFGVGGAGQFVKRVVNVSEKAVTGEDIDMREVPFARRFVGTVPDTFLRTNYYDAAQEVETLVAEEQKLLDEDDTKAADAFSKEHNKVLGLEMFVITTDKQLSTLKEQRRIIESDESLSDRQRERELEELEQEQVDIYSDFLSEYGEAIK